VAEGQDVTPGASLVKWDPHSLPIISEEAGTVRYVDIKEGETLRRELERSTGVERLTIMEHKGDLHPAIELVGERGVALRVYYIAERANLQVTDGQKVAAGTLLAKTPREVSQTQDITGGLPRVTELFEARRPRSPAVMAVVDGKVRIGDKKRGKRIIEVTPEDEDGKTLGEAREHMVPAGALLRGPTGRRLQAGHPPGL